MVTLLPCPQFNEEYIVSIIGDYSCRINNTNKTIEQLNDNMCPTR